jgi:hypothetical protein
VTALVEGYNASGTQMTSEAIPVTGIGAQAVEQEQRRVAVRAGVSFPLDVVQADAISFEPSVDRFAHPGTA